MQNTGFMWLAALVCGFTTGLLTIILGLLALRNVAQDVRKILSELPTRSLIKDDADRENQRKTARCEFLFLSSIRAFPGSLLIFGGSALLVFVGWHLFRFPV